MNRATFFDRVRASLFGGSLSQRQVDGLNAILDAIERHTVREQHHAANVLAEVHHETGGEMLGIKETVLASHKDKNPSDATVKSRLEAAWAKGQLPWVKTPYWRDGWFGRGPIQITHYDNYAKFEKRLGIPLTKQPGLALDPVHGSDIAVVGMAEGLFTGRKLSDYRFPAALSAAAKDNPRRIVNGSDGTDAKVAAAHRHFFDALHAAGLSVTAAPVAPPAMEEAPKSTRTLVAAVVIALSALLAALGFNIKDFTP